jgi:hypothetical protein
MIDTEEKVRIIIKKVKEIKEKYSESDIIHVGDQWWDTDNENIISCSVILWGKDGKSDLGFHIMYSKLDSRLVNCTCITRKFTLTDTINYDSVIESLNLLN